LTCGGRSKSVGGLAGRARTPVLHREKFMNKLPSSCVTPDQDAIVGEVEIAAPPERVAGRACSNCFENIANKNEETFHGYQCSYSR
jgi:hypothetical protein